MKIIAYFFNNKALVVKQYEPWFSTTQLYEPEAELTQYGVSPLMHYDPLGRNIKTDFPDGSFSKVEFTPWMQKNFDQNDTIQDSDWIIAANAGTLAQQRAAEISAPHHNSPQRIDFDTLGRPFCTTDDNMTHGLVVTHNTLDILGRPIALTDALGRVATTRIFAMSEKHLLSVQNIDSGRRRMLSDVAGKPIGQWDSRGHRMRYTYDELQRPVAEYVSNNGANEFLSIKNVYGSSAVQKNIGRIHQIYDQSGLTEFSAYDFKGNPLEQKKKFCQSYNAPINWAAVPAPLFQKKYNSTEDEVFTTSWSYNALNQPLLITLPDGSSQQNTYNKAGLLETVSSNGQAYVTNINYNEKGQRSDIFYGNGSKTRYEYDKNTFRLIRLLTTRNNGNDILQDIHYTHDPVGNIVEIVDNAQQLHYFNNAVIEPKGQYEYDALYRLVKATGRELASLQLPTHSDFANNIPVPNMGNNAMQNYTQQFTYDELGNIIQMKSVGRWTRDYNYDILHNNYLTGHAPRAVDYTYDEHGNMLTMPHLTSMGWDYKDQLSSASNGTFTSYYVYDAGGQRVRKVVIKGNVIEERIYVGSYERFIKTVNGSQTIERISVSIAEVAEEPREEEDNTRAVYQIDLNKRIALIEYIEGQSPTIRYQLSNHLGSASLELNATGQIISYEEYHPFGTTSYRSGSNETEVSLKRYKYIGKERDEETGLYYYGARYYAAWIGRFVSVDPLADKYLNLSPYAYVANNPIKYIDPDGRDIFIKHDNQRFLYSEGILFKNVEGGWVAFEPDKDSYLALIHEALAILESKPDGKELIQYFKGDKNFVEIRARLKKERGTGNEIKAFAIVTEKKPQGSMVPTEKGLLRSPLFVTLGHELAHRKEIIEGTFDDNEWFLINGEKIINAEKTATHYENIIRAEHKLPLRTYYAVDTVNREGIGPLLIENGKSLFFDLWGKPFDYRYRVGRRDFINSL